jgi:AraC-like DNA-binding protein
VKQSNKHENPLHVPPLVPARAMLRSTKARYYVAAMRERGFADSAVLAGSGISPGQLEDSSLLIEEPGLERIVGNMIRLTGNPALGFDTGEAEQPSDLGIVAHAMMSSRTLRQAVSLWMRYSNLVGMLVHLSLHEDDNAWRIAIGANDIDPAVYRFCVEEIMVVGLRLGEVMSRKRFNVTDCCVSYGAPAHADRYRQFLGCCVRFGAGRTELTIAAPLLDMTLNGNDPEFNEICLRHCGQIMRQIASRSPAVARLRSLFLGRPGAIPSLEEASSLLNMSPRSLRRHLAQEGTSYRLLVDEFRRDLAREYLQSEQITAKEVAYLLGFRSTDAFRRAFKVWTGKTVQQFQTDCGA